MYTSWNLYGDNALGRFSEDKKLSQKNTTKNPRKSEFGLAPNPFFVPSGGKGNDTLPFYYDGNWHLFLLELPVLAHYVGNDLIHWQERPVVVAIGEPGEADHGDSIGTGCVIEHGGRFYCYYTTIKKQTLCLALSDDLDHWTKYEHNPILQGDGELYDPGNFRDPFVLFNPEENVWWMLFYSRLVSQPGQRAACVGLAISKDLLNWEIAPPLWAPGADPRLECPQLIHHGNVWYLATLSRYSRCRFADSLAGPWQRPPIGDLGTLMAHAGSRPASDGLRWISWPFILTPTDPQDFPTNDIYDGGALAIPRQWEFHDDGSVTQRPADEIIAAMHTTEEGDRKPLDGAQVFIGDWELEGGVNARSLSSTAASLMIEDIPDDFYFEADLTFQHDHMEAHILLNVAADLESGYELALYPDRDLVILRPISYWDGIQSRVMETLSVRLDPGRPIKIRLFRAGTILEAFVGDQAVLTYRLYEHRGDRLLLEFRDGRGEFSGLLMRRLDPLIEG